MHTLWIRYRYGLHTVSARPDQRGTGHSFFFYRRRTGCRAPNRARCARGSERDPTPIFAESENGENTRFLLRGICPGIHENANVCKLCKCIMCIAKDANGALQALSSTRQQSEKRTVPTIRATAAGAAPDDQRRTVPRSAPGGRPDRSTRRPAERRTAPARPERQRGRLFVPIFATKDQKRAGTALFAF